MIGSVIVWKSNNSIKNSGPKRVGQTLSEKRNKLNSSDVPFAPQNGQHPMDAFSGIGTIYNVR